MVVPEHEGAGSGASIAEAPSAESEKKRIADGYEQVRVKKR